MRTAEEFAEYANKELNKVLGDDEAYHSKYDDLLEERLNEIEPALLNAMPYHEEMSRWCA